MTVTYNVVSRKWKKKLTYRVVWTRKRKPSPMKRIEKKVETRIWQSKKRDPTFLFLFWARRRK